MKKLSILLILFAFLIVGCKPNIAKTESQQLFDGLSDHPAITIEKYEKTSLGFFLSFTINQPIDYKGAVSGTFQQRVFVNHIGFNHNTVLITEGYGAAYANNPTYRCELANYLNANQVCVEHRYFAPSVPDSLNFDWQYLTVENAANDHHQIVTLLKHYYSTGKWINTGISKGGQTATYHRFFFPEDVDVTVGYVCPINFSRTEERCQNFLHDEVGTQECRELLHDYQRFLLEQKTAFLPEMQRICAEKEYVFSISDEEVYELAVLEYPFAFWQWGSFSCEDIPTDFTKDAAFYVNNLDAVAGFSFFSVADLSLQPFFYQALKEIGMYYYTVSEFPSLVTAVQDSTFMFLAPEGAEMSYVPATMQQVDEWLQDDAEKMIFVYGADDPWTATSARVEGNKKCLKVLKPQGSHTTRIRNLMPTQRQQVLDSLNKWLGKTVDFK